MNIDKELIMKHLLTICCAVSILLLLLPFANVTAIMENGIEDTGSSGTLTGFGAMFGTGSTIIAWVMLLCPIILIAMNYIKQLDKFKNMLALILPMASILSAILSLFFVDTPNADAQYLEGTMELDISASPSIGFFLLIVAFAATFVAGAITFHGLKLSKEGIAEFGDKIKKEGIDSFKK